MKNNPLVIEQQLYQNSRKKSKRKRECQARCLQQHQLWRHCYSGYQGLSWSPLRCTGSPAANPPRKSWQLLGTDVSFSTILNMFDLILFQRFIYPQTSSLLFSLYLPQLCFSFVLLNHTDLFWFCQASLLSCLLPYGVTTPSVRSLNRHGTARFLKQVLKYQTKAM